jgi:hypothetical protein
MSLIVSYVSYRQKNVGSCFLIQSANLCIQLESIPFGIIIERCFLMSHFFSCLIWVLFFFPICLSLRSLLVCWVDMFDFFLVHMHLFISIMKSIIYLIFMFMTVFLWPLLVVFVQVSSVMLDKWSLIAFIYAYLGRPLSLYKFWRVTLLNLVTLVGSHLFQSLKYIIPYFLGFQGLYWEISYNSSAFAFVTKFFFSSCSFQYPFLVH